MKARIAFALALLAFTFAATAGSTRMAVRKSVENSMLLTGSIEIEKDGSVGRHSLDQPEKVPQVVRDLVDKAVPLLRFGPVKVGGMVVRARTKMALRVVATQREEGGYTLRLGSISFSGGETKEAQEERDRRAAKAKMTPPKYPPAAYMSHVTGTVYLLVKVNAQGKVDDVATEQVNLTVVGTERQMQDGRKVLAQASMTAARRWQFEPPSSEELAKEGFGVIRVPVDFMLNHQELPGYGEWAAYVPGPRAYPEWVTDPNDRRNPDALMAGVAYPLGEGPKLLTPLGEG